MILLSVDGAGKHFGPEPVLGAVTFDVRPDDRIGLVGPNGSGKTTLLRILAGKDEPDAGTCEVHWSVSVGYLEQQPEWEIGRTLWDEARSALAPLIALQREALAVSHSLSLFTKKADPVEYRRLAARYDHLQQELDRHDAYNLDHKIERVLEGLGFAGQSFQLPVEALSGGEQNRLMLAKLLLAEPDLMVLDEPSNHLDIEATQWLEEFLLRSRAAMIVVSHDRYFLDKVTNRTLELFRGTVESYSGNFSSYRKQKEERLLVERRAYQKQQTEIAKAEEFIRRNAYGQKHAQAEDRRKKLARVLSTKKLDPPREIPGPPMGFPEVARSGDVVLRAEGLAKAYDRPLFADVTFDVTRGQRWAILGPNGSGKTTLLKCLLGLLEPDEGKAMLGQGVTVGYFDQHLSALDEQAAVADAVAADRRDFPLEKRRSLLARFGILGDSALQPVGLLSGGERCRLALARLAASEANSLVLDEPTNHLDLWARTALERSLIAFAGTVLLVSHDRYFVNQVADHLLIIEPDRVRVIEGNYTTYQHLVESRESKVESGEPKVESRGRKKAAPGCASFPSSPLSPSSRRGRRRFPYRKVEDLEREIFEREARLEQLHAALTDPETLRDGRRVREIKEEIADQQQKLQTLYPHWEEATELNG